MLPILGRLPTLRVSARSTLQILKRPQSLSINEKVANRQRQALLRGGLAIVAIGGTGYLLHKVESFESMIQCMFFHVLLIDFQQPSYS